MNNNLELWNSVSETPRKFVKDPTKGTNGLSSINSQYYIMKATEVFGPAGIGWGWSVMERTITKGHTVKHPDGDFDVSQMTLKIKFWYKLGDERGEFEQFGHTPFIMKTKWGASVDSDPEKKSLTDAIKKSLTFLGIGSDVHLGQFDDVNYLQQQHLEENIKADIEREEKENLLKEGVSLYMTKALEMYPHITTEPAINQQYKKDVSHIKREYARLKSDPVNTIQAITNAATQQKEIIKGKK